MAEKPTARYVLLLERPETLAAGTVQQESWHRDVWLRAWNCAQGLQFNVINTEQGVYLLSDDEALLGCSVLFPEARRVRDWGDTQ